MNGSAEKQYNEECAERAYNKAIHKLVFGCLVKYLKHAMSMYRAHLKHAFLKIFSDKHWYKSS